MYGVNQENYEAGGVQDSQHQWWKASLLDLLPAIKVIGQSRIWNYLYCTLAILFTNSGCVLK